MPAPAPVRVAGDGRHPDGRTVTWVVSEGRRGRRWRETIAASAGPVAAWSSLLLETGPDGRFLHLELSTGAGLLTLHPESDGTIHGNAVTTDGVRHVIGLPFPVGAVVLVDGSPIAAAAAIRGIVGVQRATVAAQGASTGLAAIRVSPALDVVPARIDLEATAADAWWIDGMAVRIDRAGLPRLDAERRWKLELGAPSWTDRGQTPPDAPVDRESRG